MRPQDIKVGESYRFRAHPHTGYAKVLKKLKAKEDENTNSYAVVKCEHTMYKNDTFGFKRYFRPVDLIKDE